MCGIWALLSNNNINEYAACYQAFMQIKHRGPEYSSFDLINDKILLGFHRLAIIDTSIEGNQPFHISRDDGSYFYTMCNGEIFDYKKIIENESLRLKTHCDCEVIPLLYEKYGNVKTVAKILSKYGSEYAFTIIDVSKDGKQKMYACRDPLGVRPLYYSFDKERIAISSEMKGLYQLFDEVHDLPGGKIITYSENKLTIESFFDLHTIEQSDIPYDMAKEIIKELFETAVKKRLTSDRDIAALLSGGLDSSLVVALMRKYLGKSFTVYTIAFKEGSDDLPKAKLLAEYLDLNHEVIEIDYKEALDLIPEVIKTVETWDITTIRASVMQYIIGRHIKKTSNNRVIMVGEGSDELFQGYLYFHNAPDNKSGRDESIKLLQDVHLYDGKRTDRTMARHGLEVRVPFLDTKLVEAVLSFQDSHCRPVGNMEKYILRQAFLDEKIIINGIEKPLLPDDILFRQKNAFSDAVSVNEKSWYSVIQDYCQAFDKENVRDLTPGEPFTNESGYYLSLYVWAYRQNLMSIIPYYWMPKWSKTNDPSARTLEK